MLQIAVINDSTAISDAEISKCCLHSINNGTTTCKTSGG
jgi:hypothetical protein